MFNAKYHNFHNLDYNIKLHGEDDLVLGYTSSKFVGSSAIIKVVRSE